ncbi:hypothetical protein G4B88_027830 [Cannabis sativa]|uniref:LysM domain-containing protein n=1 Tax=Cannabis sativa TaxID=3483 RepID=A0A7J6DKR9_CANSA|nr:hypothetical protein G4B88_027830 [Cannabis sativa]
MVSNKREKVKEKEEEREKEKEKPKQGKAKHVSSIFPGKSGGKADSDREKMEREKRYRNGNGNGNGFGFGNYSNDFYCDIDQNRLDQQQPETNGHHNHNHPTTTSTPSPSSSSSSSSQPPLGYIEHIVTKFDTLAGVAIKYGVEVSDIKKMNGLVTDLQMFALKSIQIPLPGRHPPSPCLSNGSNTPGPKAAGRTMATDETGGLNPIPVGLGDSILTEGFTGVRKSSSTPSLQDPDSNGSIRPPSKWSQKSDNQGFSTASLAKPIFDGLPKPITGRRSKAALD